MFWVGLFFRHAGKAEREKPVVLRDFCRHRFSKRSGHKLKNLKSREPQSFVNERKALEVGNFLDGFPLGVARRLFFGPGKGFVYGLIGRIGLQVLDFDDVTRKRGVVLGCQE